MARKNCTNIGGQAVLEGVMMRGTSVVATAVRKESGEITLETKRLKTKKSVFSKIPVIRGVINFFSSLVMGTKILMRSAEVVEEEIVDRPKKEGKIDIYNVAIYVSVLLGILLAVGLFIILPQLVTTGIEKIFSWQADPIVKNLVSGLIRIIIFFCYILLVSLMKDIKRVFMYHGAEHKTISCYENGLELTVENVKKCSRLHDRCGTNFLFIVMMVSILFFSLVVGWQENFFQRVILRILLLPLVAGLSYEVLKFLARFDNKLVKILKAPGLLLQRFTTSEPDDEMIEVAIKSFTAVLEMESDPTIPEVTFEISSGTEGVKNEVINVLNNLKSYDNADVDWILCEALGVSRGELSLVKNVSDEQRKRAIALANERASGRPLQYVLGYTEFYGNRIKVDERVLIPRIDTERLAEHAVGFSKGKKCLDLCTGSGAIGITLALNGAESVTLSDVSEEALEVARENAENHGLALNIVKSDMFDGINEKFDVIVSNPPYIPTLDICKLDLEVKAEPVLALDGGTDGLNFYKIIASNALEYLNDGGVLLLEIGIGQSDAVCELLSSAGFADVKVFKDYSDIDRVIVAKRN